MKSQRGFTLIELMIYVGLTALVMGLFAAILITVTRITGQQSSSSQVTSELSFLMTTIKREIHESLGATVNNTQVILIKDATTNPVTTSIINYDADAKKITIEKTGPAPTTASPLSTNHITVDNVLFEKMVDETNPSSTIIRMTITASANTTNPQNQSTKTLTATAAPFILSQ